MADRVLLIPYGKDLLPVHLAAIRRAAAEFRVIFRPPPHRLRAAAARAEIMITHRWPSVDPARWTALRWVHSTSGGVDRLPLAALAGRGVIITNSGAAYARAVAEHAIALVLCLAKGVGRNGAARDLRAWRWPPVDVIRGRVLGVVGMGRIGREIAAIGRALGMRVAAAANPAHHRRAAMPLRALLASSDYIVLAVPLAPSTRHLIDARALASCRPSACLVNVSRGGVVDEAALVTALRRYRLRGVALDVFATEPYPSEAPLLRLPQVVATPHVAGSASECMGIAVEMFCDNFRRYVRRERLRSRVSARLGY